MSIASESDRPLALIAGSGGLPALISEYYLGHDRPVHVVKFPGTGGAPRATSVIHAEFELLGSLFRSLKELGCRDIAVAGSIQRPNLVREKFDSVTLHHAARFLPVLSGGDDRTLKVVRNILEDEGFRVFGPHDLMPSLLPSQGVLTSRRPDRNDELDGLRASQIHAAVGNADVGQAIVVAQGLCIAIETIQGTDRMLEFVADTIDDHRPDPGGGRGVLFKAPKISQDREMDMPTIGPKTVIGSTRAGLAGIIVEMGGVIVPELDRCVHLANESGIFIWVRDRNSGHP